MIQGLAILLRHRILLGSILIVAIAAIIIERALNDLLLNAMNPWSVLGLGILVFASTFIFTLKRVHISFWLLAVVGGGLIYYGIVA